MNGLAGFGQIAAEERSNMNLLYNSAGYPVACEADGSLFSPSGRNIGRLVKKAGVFADLNGHYLGEIICVNRLVYNRCSKYLHADLGQAQSQKQIRTVADPRKYSRIQLPAGYEDLQPTG